MCLLNNFENDEYIYICSHRPTGRPINEIDVNNDNIRIASVYLQLLFLQRIVVSVIKSPLNFVMSHCPVLIVIPSRRYRRIVY